MNAYAPADTLHRPVKHAIDNGIASRVDEANAIFLGYRLAFSFCAPCFPWRRLSRRRRRRAACLGTKITSPGCRSSDA